jgi:antitoxin StbD
MTELRAPQKVLDRANGQPVAILKNSALVGYLVPAEAFTDVAHHYTTAEDVMQSLERTRERAQPVLDYQKDK